VNDSYPFSQRTYRWRNPKWECNWGARFNAVKSDGLAFPHCFWKTTQLYSDRYIFLAHFEKQRPARFYREMIQIAAHV